MCKGAGVQRNLQQLKQQKSPVLSQTLQVPGALRTAGAGDSGKGEGSNTVWPQCQAPAGSNTGTAAGGVRGVTVNVRAAPSAQIVGCEWAKLPLLNETANSKAFLPNPRQQNEGPELSRLPLEALASLLLNGSSSSMPDPLLMSNLGMSLMAMLANGLGTGSTPDARVDCAMSPGVPPGFVPRSGGYGLLGCSAVGEGIGSQSNMVVGAAVQGPGSGCLTEAAQLASGDADKVMLLPGGSRGEGKGATEDRMLCKATVRIWERMNEERGGQEWTDCS